MNKNKSKKAYQPKQPYRRDRGQRVRRPTYKSRLPKWLARQPIVQRFNRMTRKRKIALIGWTGGGALIVIALFTTILFANSLSSKDKIMNRNKTGVTLVDQSDTVFYEFYNARSDTYVPLGKIAPIVKQATLASEDKDFYKHAGFSPRGIANAVYQNIRPNGLNNGGSTITQQLVKNSLLSEKRSLLRKYQELILSAEIERRYSKDEILEMYLNSVYFGEGAFGIEDAAQVYFNKSSQDLTIAEATLLVGLLPAPSAYSPISGSPEKAETRQDYVLARMQEDGYIDQAAEQAADDAPLNYSTETLSRDFRAPHFALMVKEELEKKYGEEKIARSGYRVVTTLNLDWQTKAENAVSAQVARLARSSVSNGAAIVVDPSSGEIRALVGSHNWDDEQNGKLNMTTATRQPGSSFKPIVYASGIENEKFSAASTWEDKATDFGGGYSPKNYDLRFHGTVTTRQSLANSYNIPAVAALQKNGIQNTVSTAKKLGLTTLEDAQSYGLSLALGSSQAKLTEMTNAYATLANQGKFNELTTITSITNKDRKTIFTHKAKNKIVLSDQTAHIMSSMMSDQTARSSTFGSSLNLQNQRPAAVKTGTTENYRDAWTIGYTPSLAVGVWIGNNDNTPMSSVAGASGAAPIWRSIMNLTLAGTPVQQFVAPKGLSVRSICRSNGALAQNAGDNTMTEYFRPGTLPTATCNDNSAPQPTRDEATTNQQTDKPAPVKEKEDKPTTDPPDDETEQTPPVITPPITPTPLANP